MFHDELFPTPAPVIKRMVEPWATGLGKCPLDMKGLRVLDPSAGTGALLKYVVDNSFVMNRPETLDAVEINEPCRILLQADVNINLVGRDFLQFQPAVPYDVILMNPPFSAGAKHLLHAWNITQTGNIVCLLNAETVRNPHTAERRQLAGIIEEHGSVEYIGNAFSHAERTTDVEVALVRLAKVGEHDRFGFWNDAYFQREQHHAEFDEHTLNNALAVNDVVAALAGQYRMVDGIFLEYLKAYRRLRFHVGAISQGTYRNFDDMITDAVRFRDRPQEMMERFMADLRKVAWESVIKRTKLHDLMSASVRRDFDAMQETQQAMDFTEDNIRALFDLLFQNQHKILQRSVEESFDLMTRYHKENRVHVEGWHSNDAFKVAPKVVLPNCVSLGITGGMEVSHWREKELNDIDRGVAMVDGRKLGHITTIAEALYEKFKGMRVRSGTLEANTCTSTYFHIRFFKKGTIHLTWLDEGVRDRFNITAAQCKKWLPMDYQYRPPSTSKHSAGNDLPIQRRA